VFAAEIDLDRLSASGSPEALTASPLPRFPAIVRDIAILVDDTLSAESVRGTIRRVAPDMLVDATEFDRYQGKGIPDGKVSLALRLTFQSPERTLTDTEVQHATNAIVLALVTTLGAVQR
jgi:phenylalanyl-tRNA synthetase beta chain